MITDYIAYTDGACDNNINIGGAGVVIYDYENTKVFESAFCLECLGSSNDAEYRALIECFEFCVKYLPGKTVTIFSDSQLIVRQYNKHYQCKKKHLRVYLKRLEQLSKHFNPVVVWVSRKENKEADKLSKQGLNNYYYEF